MGARESAAVRSAADVRQAVADAFDSDLERFIDLQVATVVQEVPAYAALDEQTLSEVRSTTRLNLAVTIRALAEDLTLSDQEMTAVSRLAARRREQGIPLAALLSAYQIALRLGWRRVVELLSGLDSDSETTGRAASEINEALLSLCAQTSRAAAAGYLEDG
jgi:hypothetical protein